MGAFGASLESWLRRAVVAVALLVVPLLVGAAGEPSKNRHAAILARVLSYELTLEERVGDSIGVAVIYKRGDAASEANADDWLQGLAELSSVKIKDRPFFAVKVPYGISVLDAAITKDGIDVLLVADGLNAESSAIAQLARSRRVLTVGNTLSYVQTNMTLCVTEEADKIKIFINLNVAQLEGIRFSSRLLSLASLIR
jgi:YfiR/HmsC-like